VIALLLLLACGPDCGGNPCPPPDPIPTGVHALGGHTREEIDEGTITIGADETVTIDYVERDGRTIRVTYRRAE
jgi:hypothetical protein